MPASTEQRAFGQVWSWLGAKYLLIAPDRERTKNGIEAWLCLYLGPTGAKNPGAMWIARIRENTHLLDSMAWYGTMEQWERVE